MIGGAEKLILDTVPLMVQRGIVVDIVLLQETDSAFYHELKAKDCCNIICLGKRLFDPRYILKIASLFRDDYDLIHVHLFPANYFTAIAKKLSFNKTPLVFTEHSTGNKRMDSKKLRCIEKWIYKSYNKVVCITPEVKLNVIDKLKVKENKLKVIQNGINLTTIQKAEKNKREDFNLSEDDRLLIMVAGFRVQKDQDTLIRVLKELPKNHKLLLVGDGARRSTLEALTSKLELNSRVHFLGLRSDVNSLLKMSDVAVLSSHWEGFGLAAAEAMACGIPTIGSNVDGLAQVIEGGGLLFDQGDISGLREIILSLEEKELYKKTAAAGIEKAKEYSIEKMVDSTIKLYEEIIS